MSDERQREAREERARLHTERAVAVPQGPADWSKEIPSDVLLARGLVRLLMRRALAPEDDVRRRP